MYFPTGFPTANKTSSASGNQVPFLATTTLPHLRSTRSKLRSSFRTIKISTCSNNTLSFLGPKPVPMRLKREVEEIKFKDGSGGYVGDGGEIKRTFRQPERTRRGEKKKMNNDSERKKMNSNVYVTEEKEEGIVNGKLEEKEAQGTREAKKSVRIKVPNTRLEGYAWEKGSI